MKNNVQQLRGDSQGFTLVELAVVMIIIGILIGGILKGQELITNSRVTSTIGQLESMGAAYNGFRDKFLAMPGDLRDAVNKLEGCAAPCANGNGDSDIDAAVGAALAANEGTQFFRHLLAGQFITGMDGTVNLGFGTSNPIAPIGGGFSAGDARSGAPVGFTAADLGPAVHIVLTGTIANVGAGQGILTPQQAGTLDRRLDDGVPNSGSIVGQTSAANQDCAGATVNVYGSAADEVCAVAYRL